MFLYCSVVMLLVQTLVRPGGAALTLAALRQIRSLIVAVIRNAFRREPCVNFGFR
jgi:hypothetical protein